jgi:hypothetical protein
MAKTVYYLVTAAKNEFPNVWVWEIKRRGKKMPVILSGEGFRSQLAAEEAGRRELQQFLKLLSHEEKRK